MHNKTERTLLTILTATVAPQVSERIIVHDPEVRLEAYKASVVWWTRAMAQRNGQLLVIENSAHDWSSWLGRLATDANVPISLESYSESSELMKRGKGAGEALMYDRVAKRLERDFPNVRNILKCTGRLTLRHIANVPHTPDADEFVMCRISLDLRKMDTRLYMVSRDSFMRYFVGLASQVDEANGAYLEHIACKATLDAVREGALRVPFARLPIVVGMSGSTGVRYRGIRTQMGDYANRLSVNVSQGYV